MSFPSLRPLLRPLIPIVILAWPTATATPASAQEPVATLTLEQAIELARLNNPTFQVQRNDQGAADWRVREAYGQFLPSGGVSSTLQYQAAGNPPRFGSFTGSELGLDRTPSYLLSDYYAALTMRLDGATLLEPARANAAQAAVEAGVEAAGFTLASDVTRQYLGVLRAQDGVALAEQELANAAETLELAQARVEVGAAMPLDATQARVAHGRAEVALLQARGLVRTETYRLLELVGVELDREVRLTTELEPFEPQWTRERLTALALERHPQLRSLRRSVDAATTQARGAWTQYLPAIDLTAGWSGFAREARDVDYVINQARSSMKSRREGCLEQNDLFSRLADPLPPSDCSRFVLDADAEAAIAGSNDVFPFSFTDQPFSATMRISLPVFSGFSRERQLEEARAAAEDARHRLRAEELRLKTEVSTAQQDLETAWETVTLERSNRALAEEQLELAKERYRLGLSSFVELTEAETIRARAERAYLEGLYGFHEALARLEAAVGMRLRPEAGSSMDGR